LLQQQLEQEQQDCSWRMLSKNDIKSGFHVEDNSAEEDNGVLHNGHVEPS
jgi:hypothetical protein